MKPGPIKKGEVEREHVVFEIRSVQTDRAQVDKRQARKFLNAYMLIQKERTGSYMPS